MNILGISAFYHDSAACLVRDGRIVAAAQQERFSRKKHDPRFPTQAAAYCLAEGAISASELDYVAFYDKPLLKFERLLETYLSYAPFGFRSFVEAMPLWLKEKLWLPEIIKKELDYHGPVLFTEHHQSHAASAFFASPFEQAAILTSDGVGEWATCSYGVGTGNDFELLAELHFPHSLGLLYSAFTYFAGFKVNSGEYKLMGLAPYGRPVFKDLIRSELVDLKEDGSLALNMRYFNYCQGLTMTGSEFARLFGGPPRRPASPITQREMDLAASIQAVAEEAMLAMARHVHSQTHSDNLCLAGGVALNCVANGRILREGPFKKLWIQPAAGDAGGALGAALSIWHQYLGKDRKVTSGDGMQGCYLGPCFSQSAIESFLIQERVPFRRLGCQERPRQVAQLLAEGQVVGWFSGRMEFGPRALGARSILADARSPKMQSLLNLKIKYRESFRPFAPAVLRDRAGDYFDLTGESPYMLLVAAVRPSLRLAVAVEDEELIGIDRLRLPRSTIPAVTHVDYSARVQTVGPEHHRDFYELLRAFEALTGCAVLVNTSFNVRAEPIVCTPQEAHRCFMRTEMDYLVLENCLLAKKDQPEAPRDATWQSEFQLD